MTQDIRSEFREALIKKFEFKDGDYDNPYFFSIAEWVAKWAIKRCAKEAENNNVLDISPDTVADQIRTLLKQLNENERDIK